MQQRHGDDKLPLGKNAIGDGSNQNGGKTHSSALQEQSSNIRKDVLERASKTANEINKNKNKISASLPGQDKKGHMMVHDSTIQPIVDQAKALQKKDKQHDVSVRYENGKLIFHRNFKSKEKDQDDTKK